GVGAQPQLGRGLMLIAAGAAGVDDGESVRALAHATSGPCLQQNLVAVLEGDPR
ncbi:lipid-transfer protein, partial [Streptomyces sp. NPDC058964]